MTYSEEKVNPCFVFGLLIFQLCLDKGIHMQAPSICQRLFAWLSSPRSQMFFFLSLFLCLFQRQTILFSKNIAIVYFFSFCFF